MQATNPPRHPGGGRPGIPKYRKCSKIGGPYEFSLRAVYPCPTTHVNTAAVHNSSAVSLFLLLAVVVTYVPASAAKRKKNAFSDGWKDTKGRPFLLTCAPLAGL